MVCACASAFAWVVVPNTAQIDINILSRSICNSLCLPIQLDGHIVNYMTRTGWLSPAEEMLSPDVFFAIARDALEIES